MKIISWIWYAGAEDALTIAQWSAKFPNDAGDLLFPECPPCNGNCNQGRTCPKK